MLDVPAIVLDRGWSLAGYARCGRRSDAQPSRSWLPYGASLESVFLARNVLGWVEIILGLLVSFPYVVS